jgi:alpha-galactosidase
MLSSLNSRIFQLILTDLKYDDCNVPNDWHDRCDFCMLPPNTTCSRKPQDKQICAPEEDGRRLKSNSRFTRMRDALLKQRRPIFYSLCNQGKAGVQNWGAETGHSWRATDDIERELTSDHFCQRILC